jgi:hypothetical protein
LTALKKTVERNEENRRQTKAESNKKFEDILKTITSSFTEEIRALKLQLKEDRTVPIVLANGGADKKNSVAIHSGNANDKAPIQPNDLFIQVEEICYNLQDCRGPRFQN